MNMLGRTYLIYFVFVNVSASHSFCNKNGIITTIYGKSHPCDFHKYCTILTESNFGRLCVIKPSYHMTSRLGVK